MKKILSLLIAVVTALMYTPMVSAEEVQVNLNFSNVTDERLVELVESGEIPHDVVYLYLRFNQISDLTPLSSLTRLRWLYLNGNQITDLSPLKGLTSLEFLDLRENQITDITPIGNLTNLGGDFVGLFLSDNQITDLTPLSNLKKLNWLGLENNQITDISPLSGLGNLGLLYLQNNQVTDLTPLEWLTHLNPTSKSSLNLERNPVSQEQILELHDTIMTNRSRGVLTLRHILGTKEYTIADALEILVYLAGLEDNLIDNCSVAFMAAMIVSQHEPGIDDVLEILLFLADLPNKITGGA